MPNNDSNWSYPDPMSRNLAERVVGSLTLCFIILMTVGGNILVIISIFHHRPLRKVQNFFLVSLACADLAVGTTVMPFHVVKFISDRWVFGKIMCRMWITFDIWLCTASILNLCAIALDRYWAIHSPLKYANRRTACFVMSFTGFAWVTGALISVPPLFGWNDWSRDRPGQCDYTTETGFVIYSACGSFFLPLLLMCFVYVKIFVKARTRLHKRKRANSAITTSTRQKDRQDFPTARRLLSMTAKPLTHQDSIKIHHNTNTGSANSEVDSELHKDALFTTAMTSLLRRGTNFEEEMTQDSTTLKTFFNQREKISVAKERRAAKTLAIIMGVFVLCWLPFFTMYLIQPFCNQCINEKIYEAANWLGYINSSLNPIIYTIFNMDFRKAFKKLILGLVMKKMNQNNH